MDTNTSTPYIAEFSGSLAAQPAQHWVEHILGKIHSADSQLIYRLRNHIYRVVLDTPAGPLAVCVKSFAPPTRLRSLIYARTGSKAERSFRYSSHLQKNGVSVPAPLGYFEQWQGSQLRGSYFITEYVEAASDLYSEMTTLLHEDPDCHRYLALLRYVADELRKMHACGFQHNDLGGQNIMLRRNANKTWCDLGFIDLNRGRIHPQLTLRQRARDLAKLEIPSFLRRIFFHRYFSDSPIPKEFMRWEKFYRFRITFHNQSRKYRHPIRHLIHSKKYILLNKQRPSYRDTWLWDDLTGQPSIILDRKDRKKYHSKTDQLACIASNARHLPAIWKHYKQLLSTAYQQPVPMRNRIGMSLEITTDDLAAQLSFLQQLPPTSIFVRIYHHKGESGLTAATKIIQQLHASGHEISIGLIQWRNSVLQPESWNNFIADTLEQLHPFVIHVEVGHAVNRVKWGLWRFKEIENLWNPIPTLRKQYPQLTFLGPAVNDFEYHYYPPLLRHIADHIDGLSCHLYVDRRGAPENFQGPFSLLEKCALGRAVAEHYGIKGFYITETNWPLLNSDIHSPIACPYIFPGETESKLHVSPETYAAFMVRYYLISLCSGFAEKVFWWRISSRGFGLIDRLNPSDTRPAYKAFAFLLNSLNSATFIQRHTTDDILYYVFDTCTVAYFPGARAGCGPEGRQRAFNICGEEHHYTDFNNILFTGSPLFFFPNNPQK